MRCANFRRGTGSDDVSSRAQHGIPSGGTSARRRMALLLLLLLLPAAEAQRPTDLDRIRTDITRMRARLEQVRQQAQSVARDLEQVDLELSIRTRELELAAAAEARLAAEQARTEQQIAALIPRIERQKRDLRQRLVALYRLGGLSYIRMLLALDGERNPIEAMSMLSYLVSRDARLVTRFQSTREQLDVRQLQLAEQRERLRRTKTLVEQRRRAVVAAHAQKEQLLARLRNEETGAAQQLAALEEKARRLQRLVDTLAQRRNTGIPPTATDIRQFAGALEWPVQGKVIERFGRQRNPKFATFTINNGLKIEAAPGTPVRAVFQGTVLFSQWFKGYGNLIILDHGNRVFSLYGNLKQSAVAAGDRIATGQPIAGVGESEDAQGGHLYFEVRNDNRPEDPQKWLR